MVHRMNLQPDPFEKIADGRKTIELRLLDKKRRQLHPGDMIEFTNAADGRKVQALVKALHRFDSFAQLYAALDLSACGYGPEDTPSPRDMERYYSPADEARWGVVGIELHLLDCDDPKVVRLSRYLSMLLRHRPEAAGLTLDSHGWAQVDLLLEGVNRKYDLTMDLLEKIVASDHKQRYSFSDDKTRIRANQGHSIPVDVELEETPPPDVLWHGTAEKYMDNIRRQGLLPRTRLYVHLSPDPETAAAVGRRHGKLVVLRVDARAMQTDGLRFYRSVNGVWLTESVPPQYLKEVSPF